MGSNPTATADKFSIEDWGIEILTKSKTTILKIEKIVLWVCVNVTFILFMLPTVVINGIFRKEFLIGDPFYTARIKIAANNPFEMESGYVADPAANGRREIISLGEAVIGLMKKILNLSISDTYIYSTILMAALALYLFSKILSNTNKKATLFFCSAGFFIFWGPHNDYSFERPISPQISIIVYLSTILLINKSLDSNESKFKLLLGILVGLSAYLSSPYTFIVVSIGFSTYLFLILIAKKFKLIDIVSLITYTIFVIPYIYLNLGNSKAESFNDLILRQGLIESHLPAARVTIIMFILALFYIFLFSRFKKIEMFNRQKLFLNFLMIQVAIIAIVSNSNLLTGKALQFSNHFDSFSKVILILVIGSTIDAIKSDHLNIIKITHNLKSNQFMRILLILSLVVIIVLKGFSVKEVEGSKLKEKSILSFIDKNINRDAVILFSNIGTSASAAAMLENKLFFSPDMFNYNYTQKEINYRYFATTACTAKRIDKSSWGFTYGLRGLDKIGKVDRYINYVKKLRLDDFFLNGLLLQQSQEVSNYANLVAMSEKDSQELMGTGCLNFIKSRNVNYLVVENNEAWKLLASKQLISFVSKIESVYVYKIN